MNQNVIVGELYSDECDQIVQFLKDLNNKYSYKSSLNSWNLFGLSKMLIIKLTLMWRLFGPLWQKLGHFLPISTHMVIEGFKVSRTYERRLLICLSKR